VECLQYDGNLLFSGAQDHDLISTLRYLSIIIFIIIHFQMNLSIYIHISLFVGACSSVGHVDGPAAAPLQGLQGVRLLSAGMYTTHPPTRARRLTVVVSRHLAIQADDTKLICGSADKSIYCWDLRMRKLLWQSSVNRGWIGGVMFDCCKVISCSSGSFP
jgi:WD40 repeat protein